MIAVHKSRCVALALTLVTFGLVERGEAQQAASRKASGSNAAPPVTAPKAPATFFFVQWELFSGRESKQKAMQEIVDEVPESLSSRGVRFVSDPLRKSIHSKEQFPITTLLGIAKDVEASHLLYLTMTRSGRARLQCFDLSGRMAWEEVAKGARASGLPEHNTRVMMKNLKKRLEPRIGTECLQVAGASDAARASPEATAQP